MLTSQPLWKAVWIFLRYLKIDLPYKPAISLLGIYPNKIKSSYQRVICTPKFIIAQFTKAKIWDQFRGLPTDDGFKKCGLYTIWNTHQARVSHPNRCKPLCLVKLANPKRQILYIFPDL